MVKKPENMSEAPEHEDAEVDVVSEVLGAVRLTTDVLGRFELGAPWAFRSDRGGAVALYVMARGSATLALLEKTRGVPSVFALSAGDVAVLPHGAPHLLRDPGAGPRRALTSADLDCRRGMQHGPIRFGGSGPVTSFVAGAFHFGAAPRSVLLESLPSVLHLASGAASMSPQAAATVQMILAESAAPGPGSAMMMARLADIILVHALRTQTCAAGEAHGGLCALADPSIGGALRLIHARPAEPWTVDTMAAAVGMSRSAFAARFSELVGESPLKYLTRWRMTQAAELLRDQREPVARIAERVGYGNAAAFMKAFARVQGVGPGEYRRSVGP